MRDIDWEETSGPSGLFTLSIILLSQSGSQNSFSSPCFNKLGAPTISFGFVRIIVCARCLTGV